MMENRRQQATRRLRCLLVLAGEYLKYLFIRRRRLMHKVARKAIALLHHHHHGERKNNPWPRAILEYEFSCADTPSPAFLAAKRLLLRSRIRSGGAVSSFCFGSFRPASPCGWGETMTAEAAGSAEEDEEAETTTTDDDEAHLTDYEDGWQQCGELLDVDDRAEEFINMFYEQLRAQSFAAVFGGSSP